MTVLDTDVFIDHFRGVPEATAYIQRLETAQRATTDITVMELYRGAANRTELTTIERFFRRNHFTLLSVSTSASQLAVQLVQRYVLSHGLGLPDALIAAIVLEAEHDLITDNLRHCVFIEHLRVRLPPYRQP